MSFAYGIHGGFTIANAVTVENARSGSGNDTLVGNAANNTLTSGAGNDRLNGRAGADTMIGGTGDDTYYVDNAGDVVTEQIGEGSDRVYSSISHRLADNVENLTLTGMAVSGTGNGGDNVIIGNDQANTLSGGGGSDTLNGAAGADTLAGGAGNDTYIVDDIGDVVSEAAREGTDLVKSSVSFTLGANVERLTLTGTAAISGTGNALSNILTGNEANNTLRGEKGTDVIVGGGGADDLHWRSWRRQPHRRRWRRQFPLRYAGQWPKRRQDQGVRRRGRYVRPVAIDLHRDRHWNPIRGSVPPRHRCRRCRRPHHLRQRYRQAILRRRWQRGRSPGPVRDGDYRPRAHKRGLPDRGLAQGRICQAGGWSSGQPLGGQPQLNAAKLAVVAGANCDPLRIGGAAVHLIAHRACR